MKRAVIVRLTTLASLVVLSTPPALATPYNFPNIDGILPSELAPDIDMSWTSDELVRRDPVGDSAWGDFNDLHGLWVTWNATGISFAVEGNLWDAAMGVGANSVNLYLDVDFGHDTGPGDLSTIDPDALGAVSRNLSRPLSVGSGFGVDWGYTCWSGRFDLGFLDVTDPAAPVNLFEGFDASVASSFTSIDGVTEARGWGSNRGYELYVPWNILYPDVPPGELPPGARIGIVVAIVGGGDSLSPESIPDGADDRLIEAPLVIVLDRDRDGLPDAQSPLALGDDGSGLVPRPEASRGTTSLHAPVPNPFNPSTQLVFELQRAMPVTLSVHDLSGRLVRRFDLGLQPAGLGAVPWDGRDGSGKRVASGVYQVRLVTPSRVDATAVLLLK